MISGLQDVCAELVRGDCGGGDKGPLIRPFGAPRIKSGAGSSPQGEKGSQPDTLATLADMPLHNSALDTYRARATSSFMISVVPA
jgi:hypothetical protein